MGPMRISYDPAKRDATLAARGLDFDDAHLVIRSATATLPDIRFAYPEPRFVTFGSLRGRLIAVVWTPIADGRRIISMRKANDREQRRYR